MRNKRLDLHILQAHEALKTASIYTYQHIYLMMPPHLAETCRKYARKHRPGGVLTDKLLKY
jgi:hypothetical protein